MHLSTPLKVLVVKDSAHLDYFGWLSTSPLDERSNDNHQLQLFPAEPAEVAERCD